jgi:sirohydrochlorin cobaltochelatase
MHRRAIILSAFGTATAARETYVFFEKKLRQRYRGYDIFWSYTSRTLRQKMGRDGIVWKSAPEMIEELAHQGYGSAVVQSLHVVPGSEFDKITAAARTAALPVTVGMPLLSSDRDCSRAVEALDGRVADPRHWITVLAGHGTTHAAAGRMYELFYRHMKSRYPEHVYLSMVEGEPSWATVLQDISMSGIKKIKFVPFMLVAGEHMQSDVLGNDAASWVSGLNGCEIDAGTPGLGFNEQMLEIYFDHIQDAMRHA